MCGIVGLVQKEQPIDQATLIRMRETLRSRGPDDAGLWVQHNVGLAHRRLSIHDLSPAGRQPMLNEDQTVVITYNGEIYNAPALRQKLIPHHQFKSHTDTEVIVHLYEDEPANLCQQLEGMFAFGIWDERRQILTLARDRFGEKPLYYLITPQLLAFASEPKALYEHPDIRRILRLDRDALVKYFCYGFIPAPHSLTLPIQKLPAATILQFDLRQWRIIRRQLYWTLPVPDHRLDLPTLAQAADRVDQLLAGSVAGRLTADVPVGIFLSGGLDSSLVAANVARAGHRLTAFTIAAENPAIDESASAALVAKHLAIPHQIVRLNTTDIQTACLAVIDYLDEPLADAAIFYTAWLAREARRQVTVALSGDGGDELFGGYLKYRAQQLAERLGPLRHLPGLPFIGQVTGNFAPNLATFLSALPLSFSARQYLWGSGSPTLPQLQKILPGSPVNETRLFADTEQIRQRAGVRDTVNTALYLDSRLLLPDGYLAKSDRATMSSGLELRSPFLDRTLTESVTALPSSYKVRGQHGKIILRLIARRLLPAASLTRKKMGFGVPLDDWLRGPAHDIFQDLISTPAMDDLTDRPQVERLWQEHQQGLRNHQFILLRLAMLGAVLRRLPALA